MATAGLIIADEGGTHFSVTYGTNDIDRFPKNSVILKRRGDIFDFLNGGDNKTPIAFRRMDVSDFTTPAHVAVAATGTFTVDTSITEGVHAETVLTSTGASVPGVYAESVLTSTGSVPTEDETVTIDSTVYRWRDTLAQAHDVKIWGTAAITLDNLKAAINESGTDGVEYFAGTTVHPTVIASTNTDTTQKVVARTIGTGSNSEATTETSTTTSWADTTLGGGTGASVTGVVTTNATITIDASVYTAVTSLAETHGLSAIPFQVLWVTSEAVLLDNCKSAVNLAGTIGTDYATGTTAHPTVVAEANTNTTQKIIAKLQGTASNAEATTETIANLAWADTTLGGGGGASVAGVAGDTVTIDTVVYTFVDALSEDHATAVINQVLWVTSDAVALDNFKSAINLTGTIGTDYATGTVIHPTVTATTNANASQIVAAKDTGKDGNTIVTTETGSTLSWGAATLIDGAAEADVLETALHAILFA